MVYCRFECIFSNLLVVREHWRIITCKQIENHECKKGNSCYYSCEMIKKMDPFIPDTVIMNLSLLVKSLFMLYIVLLVMIVLKSKVTLLLSFRVTLVL